MPAIGIDISDNDGTPLPISTPIDINLPNTEGNVKSNVTNVQLNSTRVLSMDYVVDVGFRDAAFVVEIEDRYEQLISSDLHFFKWHVSV